MRALKLFLFLTFFIITKSALAEVKFEKLPIKIETFTLKNGLQVIIIPNHRAPVINHAIWYKVGSADSPYDKSGLAHFLEHLMFKGTTKYPKDEYKKIINKLGGQHNAFTSYDSTMYYVTIAKEFISQVMELESDRMMNLIFDEDTVNKEKGVVIQERRETVDSNPYSKLNEAANAAFFWEHPYGRPVIGYKKHIEQYTLQDAKNFYESWYAPNNAILVITGDVDLDSIKPMIDKYYSSLPKKNIPKKDRLIEPDHHDVTFKLELKDPQLSSFYIQNLYKVPNYNATNAKEMLTISLLAKILGDNVKGRLQAALVENQNLAHAATSSYIGDYSDPYYFVITANPVNAVDQLKVEAIIESEIQRLIANGVTEQELFDAKKDFSYMFRYENDSLTAISSYIGHNLTHGISIEDSLSALEIIDKINAKEVQGAARKYLKKGPSVILYAHPISYN